MPRITIDADCCKGCYLCIDQCPAKILEVSAKRNRMGVLVPKVRRKKDCKGCLLCEMICPDMAITVEKEEKCALK